METNACQTILTKDSCLDAASYGIQYRFMHLIVLELGHSDRNEFCTDIDEAHFQ